LLTECEGFTRLTHTGFLGELKRQMIETRLIKDPSPYVWLCGTTARAVPVWSRESSLRLIDEKFVSVMGECDCETNKSGYHESTRRELKVKPNFECRYNEILKTNVEESTHLSRTGLVGELEHLKMKTRLIDEKFTSPMGECACDLEVMGVPSLLSIICETRFCLLCAIGRRP
jgi:hypothetical protein